METQIWRRPDSIVSPEILDDNSVIFRVQAENAGAVKLTGTWPVPFERSLPMKKKDATLYEVKVGPLPSDMYEYEFIIDGVPALDPRNRAVTHDGAWIQNRLLIPGKQADLYDVHSVPHGDVTAVWYPSPTLGQDRRMNIYTPPGYHNHDWQYPVLYLLHGGGGDEDVWLSRGRVNYILDNLIAAGDAQPMIVVMPNGYPNYAGAPLHRPRSADQTPGINPMISGLFEASLINDIVPYVEKHYRVKADAEHRAICGFSMGGYHTQMVTNSNPGVFSYIGVMSMGLFSGLPGVELAYSRDEHLNQLTALKESRPRLYWIGMGTEDFLYKDIAPLLELYDEAGLNYLYRENAGYHDWNSWRLYLTELVPLLFRQIPRGDDTTMMVSLTTPTLHTARLRLRPFTEADTDAIYTLMSNATVLRYWDAPPWSERAQAERFIARCEQMAQEGSGVRLAIERTADGGFIGWCAFMKWDPDFRSAMIGYCFDEGAWGQGFATEAAEALLQWAFDTLDLNRVQSEADTRNRASERVLEKLGFVREGTLREACIVNGEVSDDSVYGLLRREWLARQSPVAVG